MKIYLQDTDELIENPNLDFGYIIQDFKFVTHHNEVPGLEEIGHWEVVAEYPNGGQDVSWVVDIPGIRAQEAWDEYEEIQRYFPYSDEEIAAIEAEKNKPSIESQLESLKSQMDNLLFDIIYLKDRVANLMQNSHSHEIINEDSPNEEGEDYACLLE